MTTSIQSPSLLEKYDATALTQRIFRRDQTSEATTTDFGRLLSNVDSSTDNGESVLANLIADLNSARTQQAYGTTYDAAGSAARSTANTVLIGYG